MREHEHGLGTLLLLRVEKSGSLVVGRINLLLDRFHLGTLTAAGGDKAGIDEFGIAILDQSLHRFPQGGVGFGALPQERGQAFGVERDPLDLDPEQFFRRG